jgi:hypothetical protein
VRLIKGLCKVHAGDDQNQRESCIDGSWVPNGIRPRKKPCLNGDQVFELGNVSDEGDKGFLPMMFDARMYRSDGKDNPAATIEKS